MGGRGIAAAKENKRERKRERDGGRDATRQPRDYVQARGTRVRESARSPACQDSVARNRNWSDASGAGVDGVAGVGVGGGDGGDGGAGGGGGVVAVGGAGGGRRRGVRRWR